MIGLQGHFGEVVSCLASIVLTVSFFFVCYVFNFASILPDL